MSSTVAMPTKTIAGTKATTTASQGRNLCLAGRPSPSVNRTEEPTNARMAPASPCRAPL